MTINDVKSVSFRQRKGGGLEPEDVQKYVNDVYSLCMRMYGEIERLKNEKASLSVRDDSFNRSKNALAELLIEARAESMKEVADAKAEADEIVSKAKAQEVEITDRVKKMDAEAEAERARKYDEEISKAKEIATGIVDQAKADADAILTSAKADADVQLALAEKYRKEAADVREDIVARFEGLKIVTDKVFGQISSAIDSVVVPEIEDSASADE